MVPQVGAPQGGGGVAVGLRRLCFAFGDTLAVSLKRTFIKATKKKWLIRAQINKPMIAL